MLTVSEVAKIKEELSSCKRPLFIFHDDPDGLASFLLCYRFVRDGKGIPVKAYPRISVEPYVKKVEEFGADKVFILDVAMVDQDFLDAVNVPVVWIDHHSVLERDNVRYFNPQKRGINVPVSVLIWQVLGEDLPADLWIALTGSVGDWFLPEFASAMPELSGLSINQVLFDSKIGTLVKVFSFNLKGSVSDVSSSVKVLTRIDDMFEILDQSSSRGRLLWKKYAKVNQVYEHMLSDALKHDSKDKLFVYLYADDKLSLTKDLANELLNRLDKIIVVGREKSGEVRCSLRAPAKVNLSKALEKALVGIDGYGGGHEQACGACVKKDDFKRFLDNLRSGLNL